MTGLKDVDKQHRVLVDIINQFGDYLTTNTLDFDDLESIYNKLIDYTQYHFTDEQQLMSQAGIDQRHIDEHIKIHGYFLQELIAIHSGMSADKTIAAKYLLEFLTHWLAYHILGYDQTMARQIAAVEAGATAAEAYDAEESASNSATEPLLAALNGLFSQVSARNHELLRLNQSLEEKVADRTRALSEANQHLEELAMTDVLTGLPNRRHAMRRLAALWQESIDTHLALTCMMIDADNFKGVNDIHGHDAGDRVLSELASTLQRSVRTDDIVCRLGGDEFFIICPNTDLGGGLHVAENVKNSVNELSVSTGDSFWRGSISVGVASRTAVMESYDDLIKSADQGVYAAKLVGKNRVCSSPESA